MLIALPDTLRIATTMYMSLTNVSNKSPYNNNIQSFSMSMNRSENTGIVDCT